MEWQPYPNLPVYVVCPIDWEGHSHTLHRNYMFPIRSNLEQGEYTNSLRRDGPSDRSDPIPHRSDALPVN